jgi:hypothetical protein
MGLKKGLGLPRTNIKKPSFNGGDLIYFEVVKYSENMGKY